MAPALSPTSTFRDDLVGWEHDFDRSAVPARREADWKPKGPAWDATLRESVERDEGFEWEDELAVRAEEILMSPDRMTRAMGKVLQRGYDQERAVPLARDLARVPSPNKPAWAGLGAVPLDAAPKREGDWWAPSELDLDGIHREHARLGATYADGTSPARRAHDLKDQGVRPGEGGFKSPRMRAPRWAPADPYRAKNALYARVDGEETWWHPRELGWGEWDGDADGPVERVNGKAFQESGGKDRRDDEPGSASGWSSDEGDSDASRGSGDPDAAGGDARRRARRGGARREREAQRDAGLRVTPAERRREREDAFEGGSPGRLPRGSAEKRQSVAGGGTRRTSDGSRRGGSGGADGLGGGGEAARAPAGAEMGTGMDEPEKKRKKRFMLCC